jgi:hypothetical protein
MIGGFNMLKGMKMFKEWLCLKTRLKYTRFCCIRNRIVVTKTTKYA